MQKLFLFGFMFGMTVVVSERLLAADQASLDTRYGLFNWLDHRSSYGQGVYPEPFLVDDTDLETGELRLDWLHTAAGSDHSDSAKAEIEYGFGLTTLELEVPYERDVEDGATTEGVANIDVGARRPFYQFVSAGGLLDTTFGAAVELGIPTTSDVSHNTEFVPKLFNDLKVGDFTLQSICGYSMLFGPGDDGGVNAFEYGFTFGYTIPREALSLPGVEKVIPVFELSGETQLNKSDAGRNILLADAGLRVNLKTIGRIQPRPGIVFVFPVDNGGRDEAHWGVMTSLVFEF
ncbi:MAG TPA: hypothetical protein VFF11_08145 [Candidatus Binatia bacterium]|nr:hypothetical protein [Candidatus Binatia bacterium]